MECNKDEAIRAKEIAERKFLEKEFTGAKKFALKAQNLYPALEGISQMIYTLDVYVSAENKLNGDSDWYGILGVNPQADDETVRKNYRRLALILHPDKNKAVGADGAFKLVSEAWSLLSDKARRLAYDQKRNGHLFQKGSTIAPGSSAAPGSNGVYNFTNRNVKTHKSTPRAGHSSAHFSSKPKQNTFWTVCHGCKMQYEYLRVYLNHKLLCPNCHEPFLAVETAPPPSNGTTSYSHQWQNSNHLSSSGRNTGSSDLGTGGKESYNQSNFQWGPFSKAGGTSTAAQAASMVQQAYEKVKKEREDAQAATKRAETLKRKNRVSKRMAGLSSSSNAAKRMQGMEDVSTSNNGSHFMSQTSAGIGGAGTTNISGYKQGKSETVRVNGITGPFSMKDMPLFDMQRLLMEKAKSEICKKLNEWNSVAATKTTAEEGMKNLKEVSGGNSADPHMHDQYKSVQPPKTDDEAHEVDDSDAMKDDTVEILSISVPDPDFHDFDKDRTEKCFGENQIWAAYDDDDGMPRYYAMIHSVISTNPFKMRISWLNSKTNSELGPLNWVGSGFSKTCGDFRVGKYEIYDSLNSFSHKVRWTKGTRGVIHIYPRKGDVWAVYRNWSPEWNELTTDEVIHKYDMVEVLEDYSEELGVTVTPLIKVAGFKTVFHQHLDPREVRRIPREEMFRFSHHVPSYMLTGQEAPNAPRGCRELDPAATPSELLQVIVDVKEEELVVTEGKVVDDVEKVGDEEIGSKCGERQVEQEDKLER